VSAEFRQFSGRGPLAKALADAVMRRLQAAVDQRGIACLAVSGGSTPAMFFGLLSERPFAWDKVRITLVDERWVPEDDARSNALMVKTLLLQNQAAAATFVPLHNAAATPELGVRETKRMAGGIAENLDVAILGMGTDGHTASLFPAGDRLTEAVDPRCRALFLAMNAPGLDTPRITMTAPVLLNARALFLHIEGTEKRAVLDKALQDGPVAEMPIRALINHPEKSVSVFWAA